MFSSQSNSPSFKLFSTGLTVVLLWLVNRLDFDMPVSITVLMFALTIDTMATDKFTRRQYNMTMQNNPSTTKMYRLGGEHAAVQKVTVKDWPSIASI